MTRSAYFRFLCPGVLATMLLAMAVPGEAQRAQVSAADSALLSRILLAEQRRDSTDPSLAAGTRHGDLRIRSIARRAADRIADPFFERRDSLPPLPDPTVWPEPSWKDRYRALTPGAIDCATLRTALADSAWPVRLRAADLVPADCVSDTALVSTLRSWIAAMPVDVARRPSGGVSWHGAARAVVALARLGTADALTHVRRAALHSEWHLRLYAVRAARALSDTDILHEAVRDRHPNVREAAIEGLADITGRASDTLYIAALGAEEPQVVRAAAVALAGTSNPSAKAAAEAAFARWVARANASERDVRQALLEVAGRSATEDQPPPSPTTLAPAAVPLALGADIRLRVTLAANSGGGSFVVRLRGDVAPIMAARILQLADSGYFNGGTWHRIEHDFVIQGGAHGDNEYVGNARYFRDEVGNVPHTRGTVAMSTRGADSGDAQWFVNLRDNLSLGLNYTVFAEVVKGMDVVDGILEGDQIEHVSRAP